MFRAQPMTRVSLCCLASEAQEMALLLARHGIFAPAAEGHADFPEDPVERYREVCFQAEVRLAKILDHCGIHSSPEIPADALAPKLSELEGVNGRLKEIWQACSGCHETDLRVEEERKRLGVLKETLARLKGLDVDLSRLLRPGALLDARIGQVPARNVKRLRDALALAGYILNVFDQAGDQAFAVLAGPRGAGGQQDEQGSLGGLLSQAGWRELPIPEELQTHPEAARRYIEGEERRLDALAQSQCEVKEQNWSRFAAWIPEAQALLMLARPLAESSLQGLRGRGQLAVFTGWVPRHDLPALRLGLEARFQGRYLMRDRDPLPEEAGKIPSLVTYPVWLRPFVPLVKSYGIPRYGEFDPALLFAVTYLALFGAMFGDVGHGAVILALALFLRGRLARLRGVGMAAGASSILFGFLYGSVFGYEDVLHPIWQSPLSDPGRMLALAVAGGLGFIAVTLLINVYNRLHDGRVIQALLDGSGLAGLVFYLATARGLYGMFAAEGFGMENGLTALAAIGIVALYKWMETQAAVGERLLVTLIETLETAINLFANTLSFLRVAAFSLNHVALALAVFTLANGLDAFGHGLTVLLGNAVIIALEGGIVAIQALRLMYYEGFSRFYSGDGVEFAPLKLAGTGK